MLIKAVFCDLDGTLIDSLPGIEFSVDHALAEVKLPARTCDLRPLIGPPIRQIFSQMLSQADEQELSCLEAAFRSCYDSIGWQKTTLFENAADILSELDGAGVQLFVVTNKPSFATRRILEALGIRRFFRDVLCRDSRTPGFQSKTEMLQNLVRLYNLSPAECLYLGDTYEDYVAGLESGMQTSIVTHAAEGCNREPRCPEGIILKHLAELLDRMEIKETA